MTASDALNELLAAAAEMGARRAIEQVATAGAPRLIPLKQCSIGYRNVLDLVRRGDLEVFGVGNRKFVDREQLDQWILNHPIAKPVDTEAKEDEIDAIIAANRSRRKPKRKLGSND